MGSPEEEKLDVLSTLVDAYEERPYPIPPAEPIEALLYHMEAHGLSRPDLEPAIGSRARVSEVLNRRRPLAIQMIRRLQDQFGLSADVLIKPYALAAKPNGIKGHSKQASAAKRTHLATTA